MILVGRYGHAARNLGACAAADMQIRGYEDLPDHAGFVTTLRAVHGRKSGFRTRTDG